ncbi:hypothetical protein BC832DRAFT_299465 [Gaertneriomyces semiglobifer]|nr:hypothetical protein BC832DRAFT_299465 [Gaertneriomyces semiglobifer]
MHTRTDAYTNGRIHERSRVSCIWLFVFLGDLLHDAFSCLRGFWSGSHNWRRTMCLTSPESIKRSSDQRVEEIRMDLEGSYAFPHVHLRFTTTAL